MIRTCSKCKRSLPIEQFSKRRQRSKIDGHWINGYCGQCRSCIAKRKKAWRIAHPTYFKEWQLKHRKPIVSKICPHCKNIFYTRLSNQKYCRQSCLPMTPIRIMKEYLRQHPEINRDEFFRDRYRKRRKKYYRNWKAKHPKIQLVNA